MYDSRLEWLQKTRATLSQPALDSRGLSGAISPQYFVRRTKS